MAEQDPSESNKSSRLTALGVGLATFIASASLSFVLTKNSRPPSPSKPSHRLIRTSERLSVYMGCEPGDTPHVEDVVKPRRTDTVPASIGFVCLKGDVMGHTTAFITEDDGSTDLPDPGADPNMTALGLTRFTFREDYKGPLDKYNPDAFALHGPKGKTPYVFLEIKGITNLTHTPTPIPIPANSVPV